MMGYWPSPFPAASMAPMHAMPAPVQAKQDSSSKLIQEKCSRIAESELAKQMASDPDPRFQSSKYLRLLQQIKDGEVVVREKELVASSPRLDDPVLTAGMGTLPDGKGEESAQARKERLFEAYEKMWNERLEEYERLAANQPEFEKYLDSRYLETLAGKDIDLADSWQKSSDIYENELYRNISEEYAMAAANPYRAEEKPAKLGIHAIYAGDFQSAILALEAHLQASPEDYFCWRILGKIMQDQDQEQRACACLLRAHRLRPADRETLKLLGVSCSNVLDDVKALNFLKLWMLADERYAPLIDPAVIPPAMLSSEQVKMPELWKVIHAIQASFEKALEKHPHDPDLLTCTAVVNFISRNYAGALVQFREAVRLNPLNYDVWNKMGAVLAHMGEADPAIECYQRALECHPTYIKAWSNLSIAYTFKHEHGEAARLLLNSLLLRPQAKHLWTCLHSIFMNMRRPDLIAKIARQDP